MGIYYAKRKKLLQRDNKSESDFYLYPLENINRIVEVYEDKDGNIHIRNYKFLSGYQFASIRTQFFKQGAKKIYLL